MPTFPLTSTLKGLCSLRLPIQPEKCGLKLKVVLKWKDNYNENIRLVSLMASLKMEGIIKWSCFKLQEPLY